MNDYLAWAQSWANREAAALAGLAPGWWLCFVIFAATWFILLWFLLVRIGKVAFYKPEISTGEDPTVMPVSVVVACRNDALPLAHLLPLLKSQQYPDYEIVVVDDRSDDALYDHLLIASRRADAGFKLVRVSHTPGHISPKKFALTLGIKAARHPIILLTDADCAPRSEQWIADMAAAFGNREMDIDVVLGYSPYRRRGGALNTLIRFDTFYTGVQYLSAALVGSPYMGVGRNLAYRRSFFFDAKGFGGQAGVMGGDDDLLINRAATPGRVAIALSPGAHMESEPKSNFGAWSRQKQRHFSVAKHYKLSDKVALGGLALAHGAYYLSFIICLFSVPLTFLVLPLFALRWMLVSIWMGKAAHVLSESFTAWQWPLLDAWTPLQYLLFGLPGLLSKRITWN